MNIEKIKEIDEEIKKEFEILKGGYKYFLEYMAFRLGENNGYAYDPYQECTVNNIETLWEYRAFVVERFENISRLEKQRDEI